MLSSRPARGTVWHADEAPSGRTHHSESDEYCTASAPPPPFALRGQTARRGSERGIVGPPSTRGKLGELETRAPSSGPSGSQEVRGGREMRVSFQRASRVRRLRHIICYSPIRGFPLAKPRSTPGYHPPPLRGAGTVLITLRVMPFAPASPRPPPCSTVLITLRVIHPVLMQPQAREA